MADAPAPTRSAVLWCPDWPVVAWARAENAGAVDPGPVAVVEANRVTACSAAARAEGVVIGLRRREAQSRCPRLQVVASDPARDHRLFEPVVAQVEELAPGVQVMRPGWCAVRARGPARYYGGEPLAADVLRGAVFEAGVADVRLGIADGVFTAEQAAYRADPVLVVEPGGAARFLAPLPVAQLGDEELAGLLPRFGVRTLGDFAALDAGLVRARFGDHGARLHALAGGWDARPVLPRTPPPELSRQVDFEPALALVEQVAFGVRSVAEAFIGALTAAHLACTELRVELMAERGETVERVWLHPAAFDAAAVTDRVRWQLQAEAGQGIRSGIVRVRLEPAAVDALAHHEPGLFGLGPDERIHHVLSRVQANLGHAGVVTPVLGGGRWVAERQELVAWGDRVVRPRSRDRPWPGSLPAPLPATVFRAGRPVEVRDAAGVPVVVGARGVVSGRPATLVVDGVAGAIVGWAGPWPVEERAWDPARARSAHRFQVVDAEQIAWLVVFERGRWWAEGRYD